MVLGESCEGSSPNVFCNGPLEPSTTYYVALRAFTEDEQFSDAPFSDPIKTSTFFQQVIKCCESFILVALGCNFASPTTCECKKFKQILLHKVWVSPSPHSIPTIEPAFIEWQSTVCRSPPPPKILGQKANNKTKVTLTSYEQEVASNDGRFSSFIFVYFVLK